MRKISEVGVAIIVLTGVPQGSILGPILYFFLIYINDLPNVSENLNTILFADDSTFYLSGPNPHNLLTSLNTDIQKISQWCIANRLTINVNKTNYMVFTTKKNKSCTEFNLK